MCLGVTDDAGPAGAVGPTPQFGWADGVEWAGHSELTPQFVCTDTATWGQAQRGGWADRLANH